MRCLDASTEADILLVEDSLDMHTIVQSALEDFCRLTCVSTVAVAELELQRKKYSLILLDVDLPDGNGFDFCQNLRQRATTENMPILFLTAHGDLEDRIHGFSVGADDYLVKPFEIRELIVRVQAKLRRQMKKDSSVLISDSGLKIDLINQKAFEVKNADRVHELILTPIEFKLLTFFLKNENVILLRDDLIKMIWGDDIHVSSNTLDTHIYSLRKKMGSLGNYLRTVVKKGYCYSTKMRQDLKESKA